VKIINKVSSVLDLFLDGSESLSLEEMSRLSRINKPNLRRVVNSLVECNLLEQPKKRGNYSLGMKFFDFTGAIRKNNRVIDIARPHLIKLSKTINETVTMAIWYGTRGVLCQSIHADRPLTVIPDEGTRLSMHNTSMGKAILAEMTDAELNGFFPHGLVSFTPNTIIDLNNLKKNLMGVRQEGVAFDDEEFALGVRGAAMALKNSGRNVIGAVGIIGPSVRLTHLKLREYIPFINDCALEISKELGRMN
jgi:DNA-binding IclR family transcriptional regulator